MELTAIIKREGAGYVALCPELDIASQGSGAEQARDNRRAEIHWYEAHGIGKREFKRKSYLD